jgi:CDP-paratose 2-epimerase
MDNVLITGGAGFIGSHAAAYYDDRGMSVTAVDNLSRAKTLNGSEKRDTAQYNWEYLAEEHQNIDRVKADIRNAEQMMSIVEGHDAIVHTAGQVAVTASLQDPRTDFEINAEGSLNILEAARKADSNPAVAFASTKKVYGGNVNEIPVQEGETRDHYDDSTHHIGVSESLSVDGCEHTPYGTSKLAADLYMQDYAARGVVDAAVFRMSCIYGPRQFGNEDQGWVAHFAISTMEDEALTIFGDGKQVRDVLFVDDVIRAYDSFLRDPKGKPAVYNIGGGSENTTSLLEFLDLLEEKTGHRTEVSFSDWREGDQKVYISDISRAQNVLDWEPCVDFESGVEKFISWYYS